MRPSIQALIFDMDDTLVSTAGLWRRAEIKFFNLLGIPFSEELAATYKGMNAPDIGSFVYRTCKPNNFNEQECRTAMRSCLLDQFKGNIKEMEGATALLDRVSGTFKTAIASGSPLQAIEYAVNHFGWEHHFDLLLSSEDVPRGKPHPDVFLATAENMQLDPQNILVFEDSFPGTQAANQAGMSCFLIPSNDLAREQSHVDRIFDSLSEITTKDIEEISVQDEVCLSST